MSEKRYKADMVRIDMGDWRRASGDLICEICGCFYWQHHPVPGYSWLRVLCDGDMIKL